MLAVKEVPIRARILKYDPVNFFHNTQNVFGNIVSRNMLCRRRGTYTGILPLPRVDVPRP